jgi:arsenate reductase-like glutaredoxin family protein
MKRIYHLSTCSSCKKIIQAINPSQDVQLIDIKQKNIDEETLDWLKSKVGSYEALFSKRAIKYRELAPNQIPVNDEDFKPLMLSEYTFLKRPFIIDCELIAIGNTKSEVAKAITFFK